MPSSYFHLAKKNKKKTTSGSQAILPSNKIKAQSRNEDLVVIEQSVGSWIKKKKSQIIFQAENTPMSGSLKRVYCCRKVKYQKQDQSTENLMQQKTVDIECSFVVLVYLTKIQRLPIVSGTMEFGHRHGPCAQKLIV